MLWFDGSIRNAVEKVKSSGAFLLVFVQGEDSLSKKYETYLNEETKFKPHNYVAIKISHNSVALQQFKQIYVTVPIPSVFLIQYNGVPINVVSSEQTGDIHNAINDAVKKQEVNIQNEGEIKLQKFAVPQISKKSSLNETKPTASSHISNVGYKIVDVTEEELRRRLNEIKAFPRFLTIEKTPSETSFSKSVPKKHSARIQFRLPNNEMPSWEFPDMSTLGDVRAYLIEKMKLSSNFKLLRTYPRTSFTPQDEEKTLEELSLTPNATLIVVPVQDKTVQAKVKNMMVRQHFIFTIVNTLLQPLSIFFKYLKKHILGINDKEDKPKRLASDTAFEKILNKKTSTSNIHGFKFNDDPDRDSQHPDNGNSTQQKYEK